MLAIALMFLAAWFMLIVDERESRTIAIIYLVGWVMAVILWTS